MPKTKPTEIEKIDHFCENYVKIAEVITKLESPKCTSRQAMSEIEAIKGGFDGPVTEKLTDIMDKNVGFKSLLTPDPSMYTAAELLALQKAPVNSAAVERSFSVYKNVLSDKRQSLNENSLKEVMIIQCN